MKCGNCGERQAVMHITKILNGEKREYDLCEDCAQKMNNLSQHNNFDFHNFFSGLLNNDNFSFSPNTVTTNELQCPLCHMKYSTFKKTGKVGCDKCYDTFREYTNPLIRRIHGRDEHTGKIPNHAKISIKVKKEIRELEKRLREAIENEDYEKAANIRDQLKERKRTYKGGD